MSPVVVPRLSCHLLFAFSRVLTLLGLRRSVLRADKEMVVTTTTFSLEHAAYPEVHYGPKVLRVAKSSLRD